MNEEQLVQLLKNKDEEAFKNIIELYKKKVVSLCYSYTEDTFEAEDLSQDIFISLYNSIKNFRGDSSLSTYLYRIAVSRCIDYKRKKSIKSFLTGLLHLEKSNDEDLDEKNYIRCLIKNLPEELRTPLVLYYYTGLSQKEIAEVLNATAKTVEGRIYRAKQRIKVELEKEGYEGAAGLGRYR